MSVKFHTWVSAATLLASVIFVAPVRAGASEVILATQNLYPYGSIQEDGRFRGIAADVVACVMGKMGRPFRNAVVPWIRAQAMVRRSQAAGFYPGSRNAERDTFAVASAVIADQKWIWYLQKGSKLDPGSASFKSSARVASFVGANMHKWLQDNGFNVTANPKTSEQLLLMVNKGRLDAALVSEVVGKADTSALGLIGKFRTEVARDKPLSVHFAKSFLAKEPGFLAAFDSHVPGCR